MDNRLITLHWYLICSFYKKCRHYYNVRIIQGKVVFGARLLIGLISFRFNNWISISAPMGCGHNEGQGHRTSLQWIDHFFKIHLVSCPLHTGVFFQFLFRWIHYCHNSNSTGKETGKTHLCALHERRWCICPRYF